MSKNLSAKHYQENKERLQKKLAKDIKILLKKKRKKATILVIVGKISLKMKSKSLLKIEKNIIEWEKKMLYYNCRNYFNLENCTKFIKKSVRNFWFSGIASYLLKYNKIF